LLTPTEIVDLAASRGVRVMALTDHDTLDGLDEARAAAAKYPGFLLIPGVELSADLPGRELHMLGLFVDETNERLLTDLASFREGRITRGQNMVKALESAGAPVDWGRVEELAGEASIGRPHVARALLEAGHVSTINEAFDRFLARGMPAYFERETMSPDQAIEMIRGAGGLPLFAHPSFTEEYEEVATQLAEQGLFGMEVYYKAYEPELVETLRRLAERLGLFALGGSDFHGLDRFDEREPGDIPLPEAVVSAFLKAAQEAGCRIPEPTPA
jgi:predicted metal-dependent phosphoesterase TrpH